MNMQSSEPSLIIQPKRVLYFLGGAGIILVILGFVSQYIKLFPDSFTTHIPFKAYLTDDFISEFDFNGQPDIVIYYNVLLSNIAACLLFVIAYFKNISKDSYRTYWTALAGIVLFFAIDNLAVIYKKIEVLFRDEFSTGKFTGAIGAGVAIIIFVAVFFRFWQHLDVKYKILFISSFALYFAGTLGEEITTIYSAKRFSYALFLTLEQGLQYGGASLLIYTLLLYIPSSFPRFFVSTKK